MVLYYVYVLYCTYCCIFIDLFLLIAFLYSLCVYCCIFAFIVCGNLPFVVFQTNVSSSLCLYVLLHFMHLFVYILFVCLCIVAFCTICDCVYCCIFAFVRLYFVCLCVCIVVFLHLLCLWKNSLLLCSSSNVSPYSQNVSECVCIYVCPLRLPSLVFTMCLEVDLSCSLFCSSSNVSPSPPRTWQSVSVNMFVFRAFLLFHFCICYVSGSLSCPLFFVVFLVKCVPLTPQRVTVCL